MHVKIYCFQIVYNVDQFGIQSENADIDTNSTRNKCLFITILTWSGLEEAIWILKKIYKANYSKTNSEWNYFSHSLIVQKYNLQII